jgi:ketosteroid isomerase-like protein
MSTGTEQRSLTRQSVGAMVVSWFAALDRKDPAEAVTGFFDLDRLYLKFPEGEFRGRNGFLRWYSAAMSTYFDTKHTLHAVDVDIAADGTAEVRLQVTWQASTWQPPAARSERLGFDIQQSWRVVPDEDGRPQVRSYVVEGVQPMKGPTAR